MLVLGVMSWAPFGGWALTTTGRLNVEKDHVRWVTSKPATSNAPGFTVAVYEVEYSRRASGMNRSSCSRHTVWPETVADLSARATGTWVRATVAQSSCRDG